MTSNTVPILFPWINPFGCDASSSLGKVCSTTCHWLCKFFELVSVLRREVLSDFNCSQEPCLNTNLCQSSSLWKLFHSFSTLLQEIFCAEFQSKMCVSLSISLLERSVDQIALPQQVSLFLFVSFCIHHTNLRLLRRWTRGSGNWVSAFSEFDHHPFSDSVPFFLWSINVSRIPLLF